MNQMNSERLAQARVLAGRSYSVEIIPGETTDGGPIYVALNPELSGCISQGGTIEEAVANLEDARVDYIYFLLQDQLPVPEPSGPAN